MTGNETPNSIDNEYLSGNENQINKEEANIYRCKSCSGNMTFDPVSGTLKCPYCGNTKEVENLKVVIEEYDIDSVDEDAVKDWGGQNKVVRCSSCGAQTVLSENSVAQFCAFCGSSQIVKNDAGVGIKPESLIPFKITKDTAVGAFKKSISKKFFAPNKLKNNHQMQRMNGVYIPHWTYDCNTYSSYTAEAGTYYYETRTVYVTENGKSVAKTEQVRKTRWRHVSGDYSAFFDDVLIHASKQVDQSLIQNLGFDLSELVPYKPEYLSGYLAEKYSIGLKEGWNFARSEVDEDINQNIKTEINADEVRGLNVDTSYSNVKFKHLLLPIWISTYAYKNKQYNFIVNGQNGKVNADAPISIVKVMLLVTLIAGIIGLLVYLRSTHAI
jgi:predicted RNA-binding Zn-ribbon protein involved in translation (DUF1610 family)